MDSVTRKTREIVSASPDDIDEHFAIAPNNRAIYFSRVAAEADVWLMQFNSR